MKRRKFVAFSVAETRSPAPTSGPYAAVAVFALMITSVIVLLL
jgi:hypothetical protein